MGNRGKKGKQRVTKVNIGKQGKTGENRGKQGITGEIGKQVEQGTVQNKSKKINTYLA